MPKTEQIGMVSENANSAVMVSALAASYGSGSDALRIFEDVSFDVEPGEILAVFGPNGSGKSTLLKAIVGLVPNVAGDVEQGSVTLSNRRIGYIPQDYRASFFPWSSLYGNVALAKSSFPSLKTDHRDYVDSIRDRLEISLNFSLRPSQCSGGMLQQAAIVRALATKPSVIVGDEPFSALDYSVAKTLRKTLKSVVRDKQLPMIVVLHSMQDIIEIADKVLVIPAMPFTSNSTSSLPCIELLRNEHEFDLSGDGTDGFIAFAKEMLRVDN